MVTPRPRTDPMDVLQGLAVEAEQRSPETNTAILRDIVKYAQAGPSAMAILDSLVQNGADVNHTDANGWPILWYAVIHNKVHTIKFLLANGARITGWRRNGPWCAVWWPFIGGRSETVEAILDHVGRDLTAFLPVEVSGPELFNIRTPMVLAVALEMGADPNDARSRNCAMIQSLLRCYERRFQIVKWRRIIDETRRLQDTPRIRGARTRTSARATLHPPRYLADRVARFQQMPTVTLRSNERRSLEGQVVEYALKSMSTEVFKTLVDEKFALV